LGSVGPSWAGRPSSPVDRCPPRGPVPGLGLWLGPLGLLGFCAAGQGRVGLCRASKSLWRTLWRGSGPGCVGVCLGSVRRARGVSGSGVGCWSGSGSAKATGPCGRVGLSSRASGGSGALCAQYTGRGFCWGPLRGGLGLGLDQGLSGTWTGFRSRGKTGLQDGYCGNVVENSQVRGGRSVKAETGRRRSEGSR